VGAAALAMAVAALAAGALLARPRATATARDEAVVPSAAPAAAAAACAADPAALRAANAALAPLLAELVSTPFFRHFKVKLGGECPFWADDGQCSLADCAVCECAPGDVPPRLARECEERGAAPDVLGACPALADPAVDRGGADAARLVAVPGWKGLDNPWMATDDDGDAAATPYSVIDLAKNVERYTGYKGEHARRVWGFIYRQDCFDGADGDEARAASSALSPSCDPVKRLFYRVMSGVHASITAHLADEYLVDAHAGAWGPNLALFADRLGAPAHAGRVANLHFAYAFVARALHRAGPLLAAADYDDGGPSRGADEAALARELASHPALAALCAEPFDGALPGAGGGRERLQAAFRNVTAAMDCVGCEKCRLWGKLQVLGVASSLKVLLADGGGRGGAGAGDMAQPALTLERNEAVALVNLADRLARSVEIVGRLQARLDAGEVPAAPVGDAAGGHDRLAAALGF
jgi:ERO1-like protein alpha